MALDELKDVLKLALIATIFGTVVVLILNPVNAALASLPFVSTLISIVLLIYFGNELPKSKRSIIGVLVVTLGITAVQQIIAMFNIPMLSVLNWASISTFGGFITTLVAAVTGLAIADKVGIEAE